MTPVSRLLQIVLISVFLVACARSTPPTVKVETPTPVLPAEGPSLTAPPAEPQQSLEAGQWSMLFYHPKLEKVVLVNGGPDRGKPAGDPLELWAWDGAAWTLVSADPNGPPWRNFPAAAFDTDRNRLVVHGGLQDAGNRFADTWVWDGLNWTQFTGSGPGFREGAVMAYDAARGEMVLYGGANEEFEMLGDTWTWDGSFWDQATATGPSPRFPSAIVDDPARERVLLFSGHFVSANDYIVYDDFWAWDGASWAELLPQGERPGPRNIAQMAFLPASQAVILLGGGEGEFLGDMWVWDGTSWTRAISRGAPARSGSGIAYDPLRERLVLFGGVERPGGKAVSDTWEWDGAVWACIWGCR